MSKTRPVVGMLGGLRSARRWAAALVVLVAGLSAVPSAAVAAPAPVLARSVSAVAPAAIPAVLTAATTGCCRPAVGSFNPDTYPNTFSNHSNALESNTSWLSTVPGSLLLSQLSIPATHDSGSSVNGLLGLGYTQSMSLSQQLVAGIRGFDIRVGIGTPHPAGTIANWPTPTWAQGIVPTSILDLITKSFPAYPEWSPGGAGRLH